MHTQDDPSKLIYPMPRNSRQDDVFVGRTRKDLADDCGLTFWLSGDQIRKVPRHSTPCR